MDILYLYKPLEFQYKLLLSSVLLELMDYDHVFLGRGFNSKVYSETKCSNTCRSHRLKSAKHILYTCQLL